MFGSEGFWVTVVLVVLPWVLSELSRLRQQAKHARATNTTPPQRRRWWLMLLVAAHSVYLLYKVFLHPPLNIFTSLRVPLTTPASTLRNMLLARTEPRADTLSPPLEELLIRLSSFDIRTLYIRLGHDAIQGCEHCTTPNEFTIVSLPRPILDYIREILFVGALTSRALQKRHWRRWAVGALIAAALFERYMLYTVSIRVPSHGLGVTMWHDRLWFCRQFIFLFMPILVYVLPARLSPPSVVAQMDMTAQSLQHIIRNMQLLEMVRAASLRTPDVREDLTGYWENEEQEGQWARANGEVQKEAQMLNMGFTEGGPLRERAEQLAAGLVESVRRP
ncbi:hypothetical protein BKA62DRAFT_441437 [Auriculariales sp. MPI-PUGE-AT-0066]|nr:hypothetical protein BKA62DRAFT_441437 [Auriculariales sp. MPI-PUGE-AT-0066]